MGTTQEVSACDKVFMGVDALIFNKTNETSVKASQNFVNVYEQKMDTIARIVLRDNIDSMDMTVAKTSNPTIKAKPKEALDEQNRDFDIELVRAEIKDLEPTSGLMSSMECVIKADNERQVAEKTAIAQAILASGEKDASIQRGRCETSRHPPSRRPENRTIAEGDGKAIKLLNEGLTTYFKNSAVTFKQLETVMISLQNNTKIIMPKGKAILLILNEQEKLSKGTVIPLCRRQKAKKFC